MIQAALLHTQAPGEPCHGSRVLLLQAQKGKHPRPVCLNARKCQILLVRERVLPFCWLDDTPAAPLFSFSCQPLATVLVPLAMP